MNNFLPILAFVGVYLLIKKSKESGPASFAPGDMRQALASRYNELAPFVYKMTDSEIGFTYDYLFNYEARGIQLKPGTNLYNQMVLISNKYNIFT